jgi:hypothetical protein
VPARYVEDDVARSQREALGDLLGLGREVGHADRRCQRVSRAVVEPGAHARVEHALGRRRIEAPEQVQHAAGQRERASARRVAEPRAFR